MLLLILEYCLKKEPAVLKNSKHLTTLEHPPSEQTRTLEIGFGHSSPSSSD
jgi:hypothetical protein